jgi:flagellar basal body-associated protein FliL
LDKKYKVIVSISAVGMVVIIAVMAYLMLTVLNLKKSDDEQSKAVNISTKKNNSIDIIELGDAITVNIQDEQGTQHIVRVVIAFGINKKDKNYKSFAESFEAKNVVVRDEIIQVVREQTFEMMTRSDAQQKLKDEITQRVNKLFGTQIVTAVYFGDFFVQ